MKCPQLQNHNEQCTNLLSTQPYHRLSLSLSLSPSPLQSYITFHCKMFSVPQHETHFTILDLIDFTLEIVLWHVVLTHLNTISYRNNRPLLRLKMQGNILYSELRVRDTRQRCLPSSSSKSTPGNHLVCSSLWNHAKQG